MSISARPWCSPNCCGAPRDDARDDGEHLACLNSPRLCCRSTRARQYLGTARTNDARSRIKARGRRDVKYNEGAQLDPSQMGGRRGGSGGKIAIGGGAGLIVLIIALLFGINPGDILGGAPQAGPEQSANPSQFAQCTRGAD